MYAFNYSPSVLCHQGSEADVMYSDRCVHHACIHFLPQVSRALYVRDAQGGQGAHTRVAALATLTSSVPAVITKYMRSRYCRGQELRVLSKQVCALFPRHLLVTHTACTALPHANMYQ
jgi:hypothetical protein